LSTIENVTALFHAAVDEIRAENDALAELFGHNEQYDKTISKSVAILFEHIFVYLSFKGCLRKKLPFLLHWEDRYPDNPYRHVDLGLQNEDGTKAYIEFKLWTSESGSEISNDIDKLAAVTSGEKYIFVISIGGDREKNIRFLEYDNERSRMKIKCMQYDTINVDVLNIALKKHDIINMDILLFQLL